MKLFVLIAAFLLLFVAEILRIYFIMPFPGSQTRNTINFAYWLNNNIVWIRILAIGLLIYPLINIYKSRKRLPKLFTTVLTGLWITVFIFFNFKLQADKMFYQPKQKLFAAAQADTTVKTKLVIGVSINNEAKAYPLEIIGYHHQVKDTVGGQPLIVTYCTVCRSGRIYSPFVNGKMENFRLAGMDHFNAMFEDASTKSWWRQENGEAITGALKGTQLKEIPSRQMMLQDWLDLHPNSLVLQPDSNFKAEYDSLKGFDEGTIAGSLEHRDTASWNNKSWVIGVRANNVFRAYDWNELLRKKIIEDSLNNNYLLITIAGNEKTFYTLNRKLNDRILNFYLDSNNILTDRQTVSKWKVGGVCYEGELKGWQLQSFQSYQEFWHSWQEFHPATKAYTE